MKYTNTDVYYKVQSEGLDYAITSYISPEDIKDETMRQLWTDAKVALEHIQILLNHVEDGLVDDANGS